MKKVALVEDNPDNRLLVQAILEDLFEVISFETGSEALEEFKLVPPDLVLLDISLPDMDGLEILKRIREHKLLNDLPVIALTAHAMAGDRERFLAAGFNDYIMKPIVDEMVLIETINKFVLRT